FQAEDGIRDRTVTGVQTCALPIYAGLDQGDGELLQWQPEFAIALIEAGVWGNTIVDAATAFTRDAADRAPDLPALTGLVERALRSEERRVGQEGAAPIAGGRGLSR